MVQSLESYVAEATRAYQPSQTAIQNQLNALGGRLDTTNEQINRNYDQQQKNLTRQKNDMAYSASLNAAANGAGFGGLADIANDKYYSQSFIPAVTQLRTNQANELAGARQANEDQRINYEGQLADIQARANQQALAQYYNDLNAEREREFQERQASLNRALQQRQIDAQNAYNKYLMEAAKSNNQGGVQAWDFGNGYTLYKDPSTGRAVYKKNGNQISAGAFLTGTATRGVDWDLWNDIWGNGVNTYGIGSNTVDAFGYSPLKAKQLSNYNDLFMV